MTTSTLSGRTFAALLFDMDGTILDSIAAAERVWAAWAERHGLDVQAMHGDDGIVLRLPDVEVSGWGGPDDGLGFLGGGLGGGLGGFGGPPGADLGGDGDGRSFRPHGVGA